MEIKGDHFVRTFLLEMYKSQKNEALSDFILINRIDFLENVLNGDHFEFEKIVEISTKMAKDDDLSTYEKFVSDFLLGREIDVSKYAPSREELLEREIKFLKKELELSIQQRTDLNNRTQQAQDLVFEAIDLILSMEV